MPPSEDQALPDPPGQSCWSTLRGLDDVNEYTYSSTMTSVSRAAGVGGKRPVAFCVAAPFASILQALSLIS